MKGAYEYSDADSRLNETEASDEFTIVNRL